MDILRERKENATFVPFSEGTKITIERLDQYRNQYPEPFIMAQIILPFSGIAKNFGKMPEIHHETSKHSFISSEFQWKKNVNLLVMLKKHF